MTVLFVLAAVLAVPCVYLIGFTSGMRAAEQARRDTRSMNRYAQARTTVWPPAYATEDGRALAEAYHELRNERENNR